MPASDMIAAMQKGMGISAPRERLLLARLARMAVRRHR